MSKRKAHTEGHSYEVRVEADHSAFGGWIMKTWLDGTLLDSRALPDMPRKMVQRMVEAQRQMTTAAIQRQIEHMKAVDGLQQWQQDALLKAGQGEQVVTGLPPQQGAPGPTTVVRS